MPTSLIIELFTHQAWADVAFLQALSTNGDGDEDLLRTMQHIVVVQRLFAAMLRSTPFDKERESRRLESLSTLHDLFVNSHNDLLSYVKGITPDALQQKVANPRMPDLESTVGDVLMHVILHSQNHRGQCLKRLRELTGEAPTLDFLMWVKLGRPIPAHLAQ